MAFEVSSPEIEFALEVAERSGRLARVIQQRLAQPALAKEDRSPVTVADFAVQSLVGWLLERKLGFDTLVAEEDTQLLRAEDGGKNSGAGCRVPFRRGLARRWRIGLAVDRSRYRHRPGEILDARPDRWDQGLLEAGTICHCPGSD